MDDKEQLIDEDTMEKASVAPPDPNPQERAFTGHPDHPPASPDQPVEGNQELLRRPGEATDRAEDDGAEEAAGHPS